MVRSQDAQYGCGISSIAMVNFKMKKGLLAAGMAAGAALSVVPVIGSFLGITLSKQALDDAVKSEEEVRQAYVQASGLNVDLATQGARWDQYPAVLAGAGTGDLGRGGHQHNRVCAGCGGGHQGWRASHRGGGLPGRR
jgi:hypothetical protein